MSEKLIYAMLISLSPFGEARVGIPYAIINGENPYLTYLLCTLTNIVVFPLVYHFFNSMHPFLTRFKFYRFYMFNIRQTAKTKVGKLIDKYGFWGLMIFVMIPMPGTGAYIGSIAAWILKIRPSSAFYSITIGVVISGAIILGVMISGSHIFDHFVE